MSKLPASNLLESQLRLYSLRRTLCLGPEELQMLSSSIGVMYTSHSNLWKAMECSHSRGISSIWYDSSAFWLKNWEAYLEFLLAGVDRPIGEYH